MRHLALVLLLTGVLAAPHRAQGAKDYPNTEYPDAESKQVLGVEFESLFDGASDHYFARFPRGYDRAAGTPLLLWFHAAGKTDRFVGDPSMISQISDDYGLIVLSLFQRGDDWLGDRRGEQAPKQDMEELINQLAARYYLSYVLAGGASLGGYVPFRLAQLYPEKIHVVLAAATAFGVAGSQGTQAIFDAGRGGALDDQLIYDVVGEDDGLMAINRQLDDIMDGKPYWHFVGVAGAGHINFWSDDWNSEHGGGWKWLADSDTTPDLWDDIHGWASDHPAIAQAHLEPSPGWRAPATSDAWYLTDKLLAHAGRPWPPGPTPDGGTRPDGAPGDRGTGGDGGAGRDGGGAADGGSACDGAYPAPDRGASGDGVASPDGGGGGGGGGCAVGMGGSPGAGGEGRAARLWAGVLLGLGLAMAGWAARRRGAWRRPGC